MKKLILIFIITVFFTGCKKSDDGTVEVIPLAPTELKATIVSKDQVDLTWKDNSTNETGYKIERKTDSGNFTEIGSTAADVTIFSDKTVSVNTNYTYRVYGFNQVGKSIQYSNEVSIKTITVPILTTTVITEITSSGAKSGGNISSDGGSAITARGVVWGTSSNPTIALSTKTSDGTGLGSFQSSITGLAVNTKYYVRVYATNSAGTSYGNEVSFTTLDSGLIGFYAFNGNALDESGNENHGNLIGPTLTTGRKDITNTAYLFSNGSNLISTSKEYNSPNTFSYSVWFKTSTPTNFSQIMGFNNGKNSHGGMWDRTLYIKNNKLGFYTFNPSIYHEVDVNVIDNTWHHCVVTMNQSGSHIYLDGSLLSSRPNQNVGQNYSGYFRIGGLSPNDLNNSMIGIYDDIRIYNKVLSADQVKVLFTVNQ